MRQALAIWHCLPASTQAKLAAMVEGPEPANAMVPWAPYSVSLQRDLAGYYHEKMLDRMMRIAPTRSREY